MPPPEQSCIKNHLARFFKKVQVLFLCEQYFVKYGNKWLMKKKFLYSIQCFYLAILENAKSQLAITLQLKHMKDGPGCDTSKSDHKTAARKHKGSNCKEGIITATVWVLMPYQHNPYMARVVHLFAGSEGPVWGQKFCLFRWGF